MQEVEKNVQNVIFNEYKIIKKFALGGSSAGTFLVSDGSETPKVLKYSTWQGIGASGKPWLKAQASRLVELKSKLPIDGRDAIPTVYKTYEDHETYYYTFEYFDGLPFSTQHYLDKNFDQKKMTDGIEKIIDLMTNNFYNQGQLDVPSDYVENVHVKRVKNRLSLLTNCNSEVFKLFIDGKKITIGNEHFDNISTLFGLIFDSYVININGQSYQNPINTLNSLDKKELASLAPSFIPKYSHGDGTLRNYLMLPKGNIKVIDVRGVDLPTNTVSRVCIPYELGKMMRTIFLEIVRNNDFAIAFSKKEGNLKFNIDFNKNSNASRFANSRADILKTFTKHPKLKELLSEEGDWIKKTLFAEAMHFLADSVNRLESDGTGNQTIAYFLLGTTLLSSYKNFNY